MILFLRLGAIGFGGGMAVVALMEHDLVRQRRVIPEEEFLHGIALGQILAPFAVSAALFVGYRRLGLLGAGLRSGLLASLSPVVVGPILGAALLLAKGAIHGFSGVLLGLLALVLRLRFHWHPALALAMGAAAGALEGVR